MSSNTTPNVIIDTDDVSATGCTNNIGVKDTDILIAGPLPEPSNSNNSNSNHANNNESFISIHSNHLGNKHFKALCMKYATKVLHKFASIQRQNSSRKMQLEAKKKFERYCLKEMAHVMIEEQRRFVRIVGKNSTPPQYEVERNPQRLALICRKELTHAIGMLQKQKGLLSKSQTSPTGSKTAATATSPLNDSGTERPVSAGEAVAAAAAAVAKVSAGTTTTRREETGYHHQQKKKRRMEQQQRDFLGESAASTTSQKFPPPTITTMTTTTTIPATLAANSHHRPTNNNDGSTITAGGGDDNNSATTAAMKDYAQEFSRKLKNPIDIQSTTNNVVGRIVELEDVPP